MPVNKYQSRKQANILTCYYENSKCCSCKIQRMLEVFTKALYMLIKCKTVERMFNVCTKTLYTPVQCNALDVLCQTIHLLLLGLVNTKYEQIKMCVMIPPYSDRGI